MPTLPLHTMLYALCGLVALSVFCFAYAACLAPPRAGIRTGLRGLKRTRTLRKGGLWPLVEPLVRRIGGWMEGLLSERARQELDRQIALAGDFLGLLPEELLSLSLLSSLAGLVAGQVLGDLSRVGFPVVCGLGLFGAVAPRWLLNITQEERAKLVNRRLPSAIDLLALSMGAGLDFPGAVQQVVQKSSVPDDPLIEELTLLLQSLQLGHTRIHALHEFAMRVPTEDVKEFVGALVQAEERGNPVADTLRIQGGVARQRRSVRAEEAASKAGVAMVAPLMLIFVTILLLITAPMGLVIHESGL